MLSFDYFRRAADKFVPKTSDAAFRAARLSIVPAECYVFEGTSVKPLDEEPVDLEVVEQTLGRGELDLQTNLLLIRILERLLRSPEQDVALFAAEGINLIEGRYIREIEELKSQPSPTKQAATARELAHLYFEMAQLYGRQSALRKFYLAEAYEWSVVVEGAGEADTRSQQQTIRVLIELGLLDQAMAELDRYGRGVSAEFLLMEAEIEYEMRHYGRIRSICEKLLPHLGTLTEEQRLLVACWLETDE